MQQRHTMQQRADILHARMLQGQVSWNDIVDLGIHNPVAVLTILEERGIKIIRTNKYGNKKKIIYKLNAFRSVGKVAG